MMHTRRAFLFAPLVLLRPRRQKYEPPKLTYLFTLPKATGPFIPDLFIPKKP